MNAGAKRITLWLENRTGAVSFIRRFMNEEIPASAGWPQVFGSVALFLFVNQALTGILLSFNYAPAMREAHASLLYIVRDVPLGQMIHGLHHWGASAMVIVVVLHMTQVFLYGAYKEPREVTWTIGVVLLFVTLAFGLTGYLLPWDNRAYWGTLVTTQIASQTPLLGPVLRRLLGAQHGIGAVTFTRFYSLHVLVLPITAFILVAAHVNLVRRHGVTPRVARAHDKRRFFPEQAFRDVAAIFAAFALLFLASALFAVPMDRIANPSDIAYTPRPEWYFLFLFQSLKLFHGAWEPLGTVGLPSLAVISLFAIPFVDRSKACALRQRTVAISAAALAFACWTVLTTAAVEGSPAGRASAASDHSIPELGTISPQFIAGYGFYLRDGCPTCHNLSTGQPKAGPSLALLIHRHSSDSLLNHFDSSLASPSSGSPASVPQLNALGVLAQQVTPQLEHTLQDLPVNVVRGAEVFVENGCASCHQVNAEGGDLAPALNGLAMRRTTAWVDQHFAHPRKLSPGSMMPAFNLPVDQRKALDDYLFALP